MRALRWPWFWPKFITCIHLLLTWIVQLRNDVTSSRPLKTFNLINTMCLRCALLSKPLQCLLVCRCHFINRRWTHRETEWFMGWLIGPNVGKSLIIFIQSDFHLFISLFADSLICLPWRQKRWTEHWLFSWPLCKSIKTEMKHLIYFIVRWSYRRMFTVTVCQ